MAFIVNNGDGSFTSDLDPAPATLLHNPHPECRRHQVGHMVDTDNYLDLALGQMRGLGPTHINQFSSTTTPETVQGFAVPQIHGVDLGGSPCTPRRRTRRRAGA